MATETLAQNEAVVLEGAPRDSPPDWKPAMPVGHLFPGKIVGVEKKILAALNGIEGVRAFMFGNEPSTCLNGTLSIIAGDVRHCKKVSIDLNDQEGGLPVAYPAQVEGENLADAEAKLQALIDSYTKIVERWINATVEIEYGP